MNEPLLDIRSLRVEFETENGRVTAVDDVSISIGRGETVGLVGESGCGKTTTALAVLRLLPPSGRISGGQALFDGKDLFSLSVEQTRSLRWDRLAMVFQGAMNALNPVRTVGDQIAEAIRLHDPNASNRQANDKAGDLLELVGIGGRRGNAYPHQYSGGMRQRAMIALALSCDPEIIFADEPTTALDVMVQAQVLDLLQGLQDKLGMALVLITHDLGVVAEVCDRTVVMYAGIVAEDARTSDVFHAPKHPYTQALLEAFPDVYGGAERLRSIPGFPPRLDAMPPGCRFAPRCPHVFDKCRVDRPPEITVHAWQKAACWLLSAQEVAAR